MKSSSPWAALLALASTFGFATAQSGGTPVPYKIQTPPLDTDWTYKVGTNPWSQHPRPNLHRDAWMSLNGIWTWDAGSPAVGPPGGPLGHEVMVPSCIESGLSGLQVLNVADMWYWTSFQVPKDWDGSVLLHFEAVDYQATVYVNGQQVGDHTGGYFRFTIDVTKAVKLGRSNSLAVFVHDPTDSIPIPVGKQTRNPSHIFYTSCSGIWQSVWLESAPKDHITDLDVAANMDGIVTVKAHSSANAGAAVRVSVIGHDGRVVGSARGVADKEFKFKVNNPDLWSPESPNLYNMTVTMGDDHVSSYTGFRTFSKGKVNGVVRPMLNGEFVFMFGTLDQGYWPDGIYLAPNFEAMVSDLQLLKRLGMNMVRKHIKVEPALFYWACDKMGLLVMQDMPSLTADGSKPPNPDQQAEFQRQLGVLVNQHKSYPSIITWIIYNEGWGQLRGPPYPEEALTSMVQSLDPTRLIDSTTGWNDHGFGDYSDNHHYANPQCGTPFYSGPSTPYDPSRIGFQGEFGGIGNNVTLDHLWNNAHAISEVGQTYELDDDLDAYNYRAHVIFRELLEQIERYACSGAVYTQTSDVEGEVNGLVTYDRRVLRTNVTQWKGDIRSFYEAAARRGGRKVMALQ